MNLYMDDDIRDDHLTALLRKAGHNVVRSTEVGMQGAADPRHLLYAIRHALVIASRNHKDFSDLHDLVLGAGGGHPGILVVRSDNDPTRDMKPKAIASAVGKLERSGLPLPNQLYVLNHWR